jgi:hypothetical protein
MHSFESRLIAVAWVVLALAGPVLAHLPVFSSGTPDGAADPIVVDDVTVSRVVYCELPAGNAGLWVAFDVQAGQAVSFRLGVPMIESLADYRPALVVIGPGLPAIDLPFQIPAGTGGLGLSAPAGAALTPFHEDFTGTDSWLVGDLDVQFPQSGRYYAVAYVPGNQAGKLWLALGDREVFGLEQVATFGDIVNRVRAFHEVAPADYPCFLPFMAILALGGAMFWRKKCVSA